jgi:uncharacterized membrane protein YsdA (DUF1294 family)
MALFQQLYYWLSALPIHYVMLYLVMINAITFGIYVYDKQAAINHTWRVKESTLHLCMLIGGTLGAYIGQRILRHKTQKSSFKSVFYLLLLLQILCLVLMISA